MSQTIKLRRSATSGSIPTTAQLNLGELAINTYDGKLFLKKSVGGTETIVEVGATNLADSFKLYEYSVTSSTSVFSGSDDNSNTLSYNTGSPPYVSVFLNGLLLDWGTDYNATNGTSISLTTAAASGDLIQIEAYKSTVVTDTNLQFDDDVKALFGNDGDLEIFHNGTRSIINDAGTGNLQFQIGGSAIYDVTTDGIVLNNGLDVEANEFIGDLRGAVLFKAQAGEALAKGDVVYISGISGNTTIVSKADADDANKMPAFGVAATAITSGTTGDIYTFGTLSGLDTSGFTLGDELYVSTTAGALTNSAPTGSSAQIQKIAKVTRSDNSAGSIKIMGAGRSNATPNLDEGKIFVGNSSNQSVQVDDTIHVDMANSRVGINTTSPDATLHVKGSSFPQLRIADDDDNMGIGFAGNTFYIKRSDNNGAIVFRRTDNSDPFNFDMANKAFTIDGGTGVATSGTVVVRQKGETANDGIAITSSNSTSHRIWKNSSGALNIGPSTATSAFVQDLSGNVGIGTTSPQARLQVEEYGIDTTETSTTATTQVAIHSFAAANFRSARYTIQVTNSTDSTYHLTEILMIHDGTTPQITEYGTIFTGSAEATFDADISSGNVRLLATPATTDSMEFKVVCHNITV